MFCVCVVVVFWGVVVVVVVVVFGGRGLRKDAANVSEKFKSNYN